MGGGKSNSSTSTDTSTKVTTNTTTNVGDIGFTGKDAVELAAIVQSGAVQLGQSVAAAFEPVASAFKASSQTQTEAIKGVTSAKIATETGKVPGDNMPLYIAAAAAGIALLSFVKR